MAIGFSITNFTKALKERYSDDFIDSMAYRDKPLLALVKKFEDFGGKDWVQPVLYSDPVSANSQFATAQTLAATEYSRIAQFVVTRVKDYGVIRIDGELIEASKKDEDAFFRTTTQKLDGIMNEVSRRAAVALYRKGFGAIGQASSPGASTTLTLTNAQDIVNFAVGQVLVFSSAEGTAVLRAGTLTVSGVNRSAGTLTCTANVSTGITSPSDGDYIFISGDREDSATPTRRMIAGLEDWCPNTAPASTAFFGLDRTTDTRLGGCRLDGTSMPLEEALVEGAMLLTREGGVPDYVLMNPSRYGDLVKALGTKVNYVDVKTGTVGFRALELFTPAGTVKILPDRFCPVNRAFMLQLDTWMLGSLGKVPRILNHDGLESLRISDDDGIEIRVGYYGNLICKAPGWNCNIKV